MGFVIFEIIIKLLITAGIIYGIVKLIKHLIWYNAKCKNSFNNKD